MNSKNYLSILLPIFAVLGLQFNAKTQCDQLSPCLSPDQIKGESCSQDACVMQDICMLNFHYDVTPMMGVCDQPPIWCTTVENNQWYAFMATTPSVVLYIEPSGCQGGGGAIQAALFDCNFNFVSDCFGDIPMGVSQLIVNTVSLVVGEIYFIMIDGSAGAVCEYGILVDGVGACMPSLPSNSSVTGPDSVCVGARTSLSAHSPYLPEGNMYPPVSTFVNWSVTGGVILGNPVSDSILVEWTTPGVFDITGIISNSYFGILGTVSYEVTVFAPNETFVEMEICPNECIDFDGSIYCDTGDYQINYDIPGDCDSIVYLTINPANPVISDLGIVDVPCGESIEICGQMYISPGAYEIYCPGNGICDSVFLIELMDENVVAIAGPIDIAVDCTGASVTLDGSGSSVGAEFSYQWTAENCCINSGANTLFPTVNQQGWYYLTVTNNLTGCQAEDSVYVGGVEIEIDPAAIGCTSTEIMLHAEVTGSNNTFNAFWTTTDGNIVSGANTLDPIISSSGTYCLNVITIGQFCFAEKCVVVESDFSNCLKVEGFVLVDENTNCQTDLNEMPLDEWLVTVTGANGTFYGTTDNNGFYSIPVPPGDYTVTLTPASDTYLVCSNNVLVNGNTEVPPIPTVEFTDDCGDLTVVYSEEIITVSPTNIQQLLRTWVATDEVGNSTSITQTITFDDNEPPVASNIPPDGTVDCGSDIPPLVPPTFTDNCDEFTVDYSEAIMTDSATDEQVMRRIWVATDIAGNSTTVSQIIQIDDNAKPIVTSMPPDVTVDCGSDIPAVVPPTFTDNCNEFTVNFSEEFVTNSATNEQQLLRTWMATDAAGISVEVTQTITINDNTPPVASNIPADITIDCGSEIPPVEMPTFTDNCGACSLTFSELFYLDTATDERVLLRITECVDLAGNKIAVTQTITINDNTPPIASNIPADETVDCSSDISPLSPPIFMDNCGGFTVEFNEEIFTDSALNQKRLLRTWMAKDEAANQLAVTQTITINDNEAPQVVMTPVDITVVCGDNQVVNFSVAEEIPCPVLTVDIANDILRRCSDNNFFYVKYCNEGTIAATGAYVDVTLDPDLTFVFSPNNYMHVGGQVYSFEIGNLAPDECGEFWFKAFLDCDVEIAATHCTEAHIFPDEDCFPTNPLWSGASLEVRASCSDSTRFTITNVGSAALTIPLGYLVIEDAVMYRPGEVGLLAPGDSMIISLPANGSTWRLELEQEPYHPFPNVPVAWVEGCGDNNDGSFSQGFVNQRFLGDPELYIDTDCTQNQAPFDPNDKQGFPLGYSAEHFVKKENQIEYLIRFQNTGNDTAFNVVIRDTLDIKLDLTTLRPGAASHHYEYEIYNIGILKFTFPNIHLPDSTADLIGSQGFVQFTVSPKQDVLPGDVIENSADIYFDFNAPITTNTTFHTIEKPKVYAFQTVEICLGERFNGLEITADTMVVETSPQLLYDSILFTEIMVLPIVDTSVNASICDGDGFIFNGETLIEPGIYEAVFSGVNGCDSTVILTLNVHEVFETETVAQICQGSSFDLNGQILTMEGIYTDELISINGCDSTVTLELIVIENDSVEILEEICEGSEYVFGTQTLTSSGNYEELFTTTQGCDSLVLLTLKVTSTLEEEIFAKVCEGEIYEFGGEMLAEPGEYEMTTTSTSGCDSTVYLTLEHWPIFEAEMVFTICHGDSLSFNGNYIFESGIYIDSLSTIHGCDSILILDLTVKDSLGSATSQTICEGDTIDFFGQMLTEPGTYETVFSSGESCDSTVTLFLQVEPVYFDTLTEYVLYGEIYNGITIFEDTVFTEHLIAINGCDSSVVTYVYPMVKTSENLASAINFSIFPNPTSGHFYVQFYLGEAQNIQLEILDIIGQNVCRRDARPCVSAMGQHSIEIETESWPSGIYIIRLQMENGIATGRVVVQ